MVSLGNSFECLNYRLADKTAMELFYRNSKQREIIVRMNARRCWLWTFWQINKDEEKSYSQTKPQSIYLQKNKEINK